MVGVEIVLGWLERPWGPEWAAGIVAAVALLTELLHHRRVRRVASLAFGPGGRASWWARPVALYRTLAFGALTWGLATLMVIEPAKHSADGEQIQRPGDWKHVVLVLDVSPSMRLLDAGPTVAQSRMTRARDVLDSFFKRVPIHQYRISVVAVYNGAKPVVQDTTDIEVVRNILGDLPMHYAFPAGRTKLFSGLEEAAKLARPWNPNSTTLIVVSDGDTVPNQGMPKMPASVRDVVVVGVGDPVKGKFIDGRQSRQDVSTLRQIAVRLGGTFHNGNESHLPSTLIADLTSSPAESPFEQLTRREYALLAIGTGAALLALLPWLLAMAGTSWNRHLRRPDTPTTTQRSARRPTAKASANAS